MNKGGLGLPYGQTIREQESALVDVNTSITETVLRAFPLPARAGDVGVETRFFVWGDILHNNVGTDALVLSVRLGKGIDITGVTLGQVSFAFANQVGASRWTWITAFKLTGLGNGQYIVEGSLTNPRTDSGVQQISTWKSIPDGATSGVPTLSQGLQALVLTTTWAVSSANNSIRKFGSLMIFDPTSGGIS